MVIEIYTCCNFIIKSIFYLVAAPLLYEVSIILPCIQEAGYLQNSRKKHYLVFQKYILLPILSQNFGPLA